MPDDQSLKLATPFGWKNNVGNMQNPLARLNEPDQPNLNIDDIREKLSPSFLNEIRIRFGIVGDDNELRQRLGKVLARYHGAALQSLRPLPKSQTMELKKLKRAIERTIAAFEVISEENRYSIDDEILHREPFNQRFFFKEQLDYWDKNEDYSKKAINALAMIDFAISKVEAQRKNNSSERRRTKNKPLDFLIEDLTLDFEHRTNRKAKRCCFYDSNTDGYSGQFFDFTLFILNCFAPSSYHSELALGQRIRRVLTYVN